MIKKTGDWNLALAAVTGMAKRMKVASEQALLKEANEYRKNVIKAFDTSGASNGRRWKPLKQSTIDRGRRGTKPLIDTGDLRKSIVVIKGDGGVFVGVPNKARRKGGGPLVNIAAVHEFGKVIAQRRGSSITIIRIPRRSFISATAAKHHRGARVKARYAAAVAQGMGVGWAGKGGGLSATGKQSAPPPRDARGRFMKRGG